MCTKDKEDVPFGDDEYYKEIIKEDFRGYGFEKQRDTWKEGQDFKFAAEFFAIIDPDSDTEESGEEVVDVDAEESS